MSVRDASISEFIDCQIKSGGGGLDHLKFQRKKQFTSLATDYQKTTKQTKIEEAKICLLITIGLSKNNLFKNNKNNTNTISSP